MKRHGHLASGDAHRGIQEKPLFSQASISWTTIR